MIDYKYFLDNPGKGKSANTCWDQKYLSCQRVSSKLISHWNRTIRFIILPRT